MALRQSVKWNGLGISRDTIRDKITALVNAVRRASLKTKVVLGSAFALTFLIAPVAALMVTDGSNSGAKSAETNSSDPGTATSDSSQATTQDQADTVSSSDNSSAGNSDTSTGSSMSVNVSDNSASVSVDGQTVQSPASNGTLSKTINNSNGQTQVVIDQNSTSSGGNHITNSNVHVSSNSTSNNTETGQ